MWYLYGIIKSKDELDFGNIGFADPYGENSLVKTIPFEDISMVISELDEWKLDERNKKSLMNKLLTHQKTLEEVMKKELVIPVKFGTVINDKEDINVILRKTYRSFVKTLDGMADKFEVNLTVSWDVPGELKRIAAEDEEIKEMRRKAEEIRSKELIMQVGMVLEDKLEERRLKIATEILRYFVDSYGETVEHERLENTMILNNSFLISNAQEKSFLDLTYKLDKKFESRFNFKCLMPLPPHSFQTVVIQKITPERLRNAMELFDVNENTTLEILKQKNRELTQNFHPDVAKDCNHEEKFSEIHQTYDLLKAFFEWQENPFLNIDSDRCYLSRVLEGGV